jgi:hypothetical protein
MSDRKKEPTIPILAAKNEAKFESGLAKPGGEDFVWRVSRTSAFAVGFGRSGPSQSRQPRSGRATRDKQVGLV